jgi:hypothetical protein
MLNNLGVDGRIVACRAVCRLRLGKHVPAATDAHARIEVLLETVIPTRWVQRAYKEDSWSKNSSSRVEAGSNTSTVTLRFLGGDEKGSLQTETVNYSHESHGSQTRKCLRW